MPIARRTLLKTLPAGAVAPYLAPLVARAEAEAEGIKPMRFVFVLEGNGMWPSHVMPKGYKRAEALKPSRRFGDYESKTINGEEATIDMPLGGPDGQLPEPLEPLARHIDRITLLTGLSGRVVSPTHTGMHGALGSYPAQAGPKDVTIDAALGKALPGIRQLVAVGFSNTQEPTSPPMFSGYSAYGPSQRVSVLQNPLVAHQVLFGKLVGGDPRGEVGSQALILQRLTSDIGRLRPRVPGVEGEKLDRLADAFATIGQRQARLAAVDPARIPPLRAEFHGAVTETTRLEAHVELASTALMAGLTNVVTLCAGVGYPTWKGLGIEVDTHLIGHRNGSGVGSSSPDAYASQMKIRRFITGMIARLVDSLESVPEGSGTMMDNTLIVYLNEGAEAHHCSGDEWPMVLIGNLGGRLKLGGRFINVARYGVEGHATVAQFYTALLHAAGVPVDHFGMKDRHLTQAGFAQREPWTHILA